MNMNFFDLFNKKRFILLFILLILLTLSACGPNMEPIDGDTPGFFNHYIIYPFSYLLTFFATIFNGNYGISIIIMTILLRLALMPLMLKQFKNQMFMKEKMSVIQPAMQVIRDQYKDRKSKEDQQLMQKEIMQLYAKNNFNPIASIGCLPILIQFPFLIGFYYAIMRTPEIANSSFLWFSLGERDMILPLFAAGVYALQFQVSQKAMQQPMAQGQATEMQKQMKIVGYLIPVMMGVFSFGLAAALPLYWTIGGIFLIFQSMLSRKLYKPAHPILHPITELNDPAPENSTISGDIVENLESKVHESETEEDDITKDLQASNEEENINYSENDDRSLFFPECLEEEKKN